MSGVIFNKAAAEKSPPLSSSGSKNKLQRGRKTYTKEIT